MSENIGEISLSSSGVDVIIEWRIPGFFSLLTDDGEYYTSPDFSLNGHTWYLGIYPNGRSGLGTSGYVDLHIYKYSSLHPIKQAFSLSLKSAKEEKKYEEHGTEDYTEWFKYHEFYRFIKRSELTQRRSELMPDGVLTIVCTLKNATYAGSNTKSV